MLRAAKAVGFYSLILLMAACSRSVDSGSLRIQLPNASSSIKYKVGSLQTISWGVSAPTTNDEIACYAVLLKNSSVASFDCLDGSDAVVSQPSVFGGLYPAGSLIEVKNIPSGATTVQLVGFAASSSSACKALMAESYIDSTQLSSPIIVSEASLEIGDGVSSVSMTVPNSLSGGTPFNRCLKYLRVPAAGAATRIVIEDPIDGLADGTSVSVTLKAVDAYGSVDSSYNDTVTLLTDGSASGAGGVSLVNGIGTALLSNTTAETVNLSVSASDPGLDVSSVQDLLFAAGAATQFVIENPTDGTVSAGVTVTVKALDSFGNLDTSYTTDVTLVADGAASGDGVVDIASGVGSLTINNVIAETVNLSLSDHATTGLDVSSTQDVVFAPGAATQFVIVNPTDSTAGTAVTVTVQALDANSNIDTAYNSDVTLDVDGSATGGGVVDIVSGVGTISINDLSAEIVNLSLTDHAGTGLDVTSTQDVIFAAGAATKFAISDPSDSSVGNASVVTVKAVDANNNVDFSYQTDVTLNADGAATGGGLVDIINGVGTISINDTVAEVVNLTLSDSQSTGLDVSSVQDISFSPDGAILFAIQNPSDNIAGNGITVIVKALDPYGNVDSAYSGQVTLVADGAATGDGTLLVSSGSGVLTLNNIVAETVNLSLADDYSTGLDVTSTQDVVFAAGPVQQIVIEDPADTYVGYAVTVNLKAVDTYGNIVTGFSGTVTLNASGSATGAGAYAFAGGVASASVNNNVAETINLSLTDSAALGVTVSSVQNLVFAPLASIISVGASGATYGDGASLDFTVSFSEAVDVTGAPQLSFDVGGFPKQAGYFSGSGTSALVFRYVVQTGDSDTDGIEVVAGSLDLGGSTIENSDGVGADVDVAATPLSSVYIDGVAPSSGAIAINSAATTTQSLNVSLGLSSVGADYMFVSNSSDCSVGSWEAYSTTKAWTLTSGAGGIRWVYIKFKDFAGNISTCVSDDILFQVPANLSISAGSDYDFGTVTTGTNSAVTLTVTNSGDLSANTVSASTSTTEFRFVAGPYPGSGGDCGARIDPGVPCTIRIEFYSSVDGTFNDNLEFTFDDGVTASATFSFPLSAIASAPPPLPGSPSLPFIDLALGIAHACGIDSNNDAFCWGSNSVGQLGDGSGADSFVPVLVSGGYKFDSIDSFSYSTCAIQQATGAAYCWGDNSYGQLGDGALGGFEGAPVLVIGDHMWSQITVGDSHACGLLSTNQVMCWGRDNLGQLGDDATFADSTAPVAINSAATYSTLDAGADSTCAVRTDGNLDCWGVGLNGQLGNNATTGSAEPISASVAGGSNTYVQMGLGHTCVLKANSDLFCWGRNSSGQVGKGGATTTQELAAVQVTGTWDELALGANHSCAIKSGTTFCWGDNSSGQVGTGTYGGNYSAPQSVIGGLVYIHAGTSFTCAVSSSNSALACWGSNASGQFGNGTSGTSSASPVDTIGI